MKHISICIIALFCAIGTTQAILHPDQVGERDWSIQHLGVIKYASYSCLLYTSPSPRD